MHDPARVDRAQALARLNEESGGDAGGEATDPIEESRKVLSLEEGHDEVWHLGPFVDAVSQHGHHVGVPDRRADCGLSFEAGAPLLGVPRRGPRAQVHGQSLQGEALALAIGRGLVDGSHGAAADNAFDPVALSYDRSRQKGVLGLLRPRSARSTPARAHVRLTGASQEEDSLLARQMRSCSGTPMMQPTRRRRTWK
jgi:hypothetical protein